MSDTKAAPIQIQILAAKEEAGATAHAVATALEHHKQLAEVARQHGAEALLVCPAPEGYVEDGFNLVVAIRFEEELDEETALVRRTDLAVSMKHVLGVRTGSLDIDNLGGFLRHIAPLLATPYRNEIGPRRSSVYRDA